MPKIISANLNGIRSAAKKGFFEWMSKQSADFICVQELKAQAADMTPEFLNPGGYHGHFHYAEKKGYSGAGVYSKIEPDAVLVRFEQVGDLFDVPVTVTLEYANSSTDVIVPLTEAITEQRIPVKGIVKDVEANRDNAAAVIFVK